MGATDPELEWEFHVDWDNDGSFADEANEAQYLTDLFVRRGRQVYMRPDGKGFEHIRPGEIRALLDNIDGRFDSWNTTSALYPNVVPGRRVRARVTDLNTSTVWPIFNGRITDIQPERNNKIDQVRITAVDGSFGLQKRPVNSTLYTDTAADALYNVILVAAGWTDSTSIEAASDIVPYWWIPPRQNAMDAIYALADALYGTPFVGADGTFKVYNRQHSTTAGATLTEAELLKDVGVKQPWEVVRNYAAVTAYPLTPVTTVELWRLGDKPSVEAGDSIELWGEYRYNGVQVPAENVTTPVATTDYLVNTAADGSGTNLTASCTVTAVKYGSNFKLTLTNNSAFLGYITLLKVRGDALTSQGTTLIREDAASQALYEKRDVTFDFPMLQVVSQATDYADFLVGALASPNPFPRVYVEARPSIQFLDVLDKIELTLATKGITTARSFDIGGLEMQWLSTNGQAVRTTWYLEPALDDIYWIFTASLGVSTRFGF